MRLPARILLACAVVPCVAASCVDGADQGAAVSAPRAVDGRTVTPQSAHVDSLLQAADSLLRQDHAAAGAIWQQAHDRAREAHDTVRIAHALTGLGQVARLAGDFSASRRHGEEALRLKRRLGMDPALSRSYNALGLLAWQEGRLVDAGSLLDSAAATARRNGDPIAAAKAVVNLGLVAQDRGLFTAARDAFLRGRDAAGAIGDSITLGRALNNLAALDILVGEPLAAISSLREVHRMARATGDSVLEVNTIGQLGTAYDRLGDPQRAMSLLDSALVMARRRGLGREEAENLILLADLSLDAGDHQHALRGYERALTTMDTGQSDERGLAMRNLARVHGALGNGALAMKHATAARRTHEAVGAPYSELGDHIVLAGLAARARQFDVSRVSIARARAIVDSLALPVAATHLAVTEASIALEAGEHSRALRLLDAVAGSLPLTGSTVEAEALALRSRAHAGAGQLEQAIAAGRNALHAMERTRAHYPTAALRTAYGSNRASVYAHQALLLLRAGRTAEAFEVADGARGRALLEHLATAASVMSPTGDAASSITGERLLARVAALVSRLGSYEAEALQERGAAPDAVTGELRDSLLAARAEYEALVARTPPRATVPSMSLVSPGRSAAEVRASLGADELLLEYFVTAERTLIFALSRGDIRVFDVPEGSGALARRVSLARDLIVRRNGEAGARSVLRALHALLLTPVQEAGLFDGVTRLVVVPHGALVYLPFAALVDPATGRYVAERFAVQRASTGASLPLLRGPRQVAPPIGGASVFAPLPEALPATRAEADALGRSMRRATVHTGRAATEAAVRAALARPELVHVATHARLNARNPLFSYLQLAEVPEGARGVRDADGRLEVHELLGMRVAAPLVFLSGCETALGGAWATAFDAGEDYATMSQALLYAGARNVIATLWRIDDAGASEFARRFYAALPGRSPVDALAEAQRATLVDKRFRSPYYWAAYEITGAGERSGAAAASPRNSGPAGR